MAKSSPRRLRAVAAPPAADEVVVERAELIRNAAAPVAADEVVVARAELIAVAAYFRAEKRNFSPGGEIDDWLAAEREIDAAEPAAGKATPVPHNVGLSEAEARRRLESDGPNELSRPESHALARLIGQVLAEPMFLLLIGAVVLYLVLGDRREAAVLALSLHRHTRNHDRAGAAHRARAACTA